MIILMVKITKYDFVKQIKVRFKLIKTHKIDYAQGAQINVSR
jgi:hypothetical protein